MGNKKTNRYKKLTHKEHILKRSETYVGSKVTDKESMYVIKDNDLNNIQVVKKEVDYNPAFIKLFDEVITNASDEYIRNGKIKMIKVNIDDDGQKFVIENDGPTIPINKNNEEGIYNQQLIFFELLSGENFDDTEERVVGGRNGLGIKLVNVFSKKFKLECCDGKQLYRQWSKNNMTVIEEPEITKVKPGTKPFTRVTYYPDYSQFDFDNMSEDLKTIIYKRCLDISAYIPNVRISLNGKTLPVKKIQDYMKMHLPEDSEFFYETLDNGWIVGIARSNEYTFEQVSIVNGITTHKGGTHVNYISLQLSKDIADKFPKKIKANWTDVKNKLFLFLVAQVPNPTFDTQTKENLTNRMTTEITGGDNVSDKTVKKIMKSDITKSILDEIELREKMSLKKLGSGKKKTVKMDKLMDANKAGTKDSDKCYMFLTEGDSASSMAIAGIGAIPNGRQYNGCFPLKGKLLNVRGASPNKLKANKEVQNLVNILGLQFGKKYTDTSELRYGKCVFFCDADSDGIHIKGLLMNLFETFWPELLTDNNFIYEFITPILKAKKGKVSKSFYTMAEYKKWTETTDSSKYKIKYYKGLGTSTVQEARLYFKDLDKHLLPFKWDSDKNTDDIDIVFNNNRVEDRKKWMLTTVPKDVPKVKFTNISSFIHDEMITFSLADNIRSIPNFYDGLKPSQRKILYTCLDNNIKTDTPVSSLAGMVKTKSHYHHGEASLEQGIINLAQNYVGASNINLLEPEGQFGSRLQGGKDAASPRYVHTFLADITKSIFKPEDNDILTHLDEDGYVIEPEIYKPIIPLVLVNGAEGIGTGWSTNIPMYNPSDVIRVIENKINKKRSHTIHPWYRGFKGDIIKLENDNYVSRGVFTVKNTTTLEITELPIGSWTQNYIAYLNKLIDEKFIKGYEDNSTEESVHITISIPRENMMTIKEDVDLIKMFKLESNIHTSNMNLFKDGIIVKYDSVMDIIDDFFTERLKDYSNRKKCQLEKLDNEKLKMSNIVKFIMAVINNDLKINNQKKETIVKSMKKLKLDMIDDSYNYLLNMSIYSLTKEKVDHLNAQLKDKEKEYKALKKMKETDIWLEDLKNLKTKI